MRVPTQTRIERTLKPYLRKYFYLTIGLWILFVAYLFEIGLDSIAGAVIGAGPFVLYVIYQEVYLQPFIQLEQTGNPDDDLSKVHYDKILLSKNTEIEPSESENKTLMRQYIHEFLGIDSDNDPPKNRNKKNLYPIIEIVTTLENFGNTTANNCEARINLEADDIQRQGYNSRWTGDLYDHVIDFHPGRKKEVLLLQLVPTPDSLTGISDAISTEDYEISRDAFYELSFETYSEETLSVGEFKFYIQRPMNPISENFEYEKDDVRKSDQRRFIGVCMPEAPVYRVNIELVADNWSKTIELGEISILDALDGGEWYHNVENHRVLVDALDEEGWKHNLAEQTS